MAFYHCLLFDLDGTLLDFKAAEHGALLDTLANFDLPQTQETLDEYSKINNALWASFERAEIKQDKLVCQRFEQLLAYLNVPGNAAKMNEYYTSQLATRADVYDGAKELLETLSEVATLVLISNGIERVQLGRLERSGLNQYFDEVFVSAKVGAAKPNRRIFDTALNTLGVEQRDKVLMIGDSLKADIMGGKNAGVKTCWCNFYEASQPTDIIPDFTIQHYDELLKIVMEPDEFENIGNLDRRHLNQD